MQHVTIRLCDNSYVTNLPINTTHPQEITVKDSSPWRNFVTGCGLSNTFILRCNNSKLSMGFYGLVLGCKNETLVNSWNLGTIA